MARNVLRQKITNKRVNAEKEGIQYLLSDEEVCSLLADAGIGPEDWTFMGYHLSRYNDSGDYIFGNCRFVPYKENYAEKKISETSREASRKNQKIALEAQKARGWIGKKPKPKSVYVPLPLDSSEPDGTCKNCGAIITGQGLRFCSQSCSASFNNKRRSVRSEESRRRTAESVKNAKASASSSIG